MSLSEILKLMTQLFFMITTALLIFVGVTYLLIEPDATFSPLDLIYLVFVPFVSVLPTIIYVGKIKANRPIIILRDVVHFFLTLGTVFALLFYYGWIDAENMVYTLIFFIIIYAGAHLLQYLRAKKLADKLNEKINAFHNRENETHK